MFDVTILGGTVVDGTGTAGIPADVGIEGHHIAAVGDLSRADTRRVIDATGLTITPGFIDTHVHSDAALLTDPQHAQGLRQGITTEILGQDGLSYAPLGPEGYDILRRYLAGILGEAPAGLDMSSVAAFRSHYHNKTAVNTAYMVAHGAVRLETCGFRDIPMTGDRLKRAQRLVQEGIEQGAAGLATGLSYHPQAWSDTDEIVELCRPVANAGGVFVNHVRDVNTDRAHGGGGVAEALEIGRRSGVKVHFSHHRTQVHDAGRVAEHMALIDEAKAQGVDVTAELYPYPTGSTFLASLIPSYAHEGGPDAVVERLRDPREGAKVAARLENKARMPFDQMVLGHLHKNSHFEGMALPLVADRLGMGLAEAVCHLLAEEELRVAIWGSPPDSVAVWDQIGRDALDFLARPDYMVGSDSIHVGRWPHPRAYGTFPRLLGRLRRRHGVLTLEQMVQRMTDNPARRFGLKRRGRIQEGFFADVVVFDPHTIMDNATYDDPRQPPTGIPFVLVNGQVAVDRERCTGVLAGQAVP